ncbi:uncharacterized protein LOC110105291 [Dendrobium catenatum]|uniref:uncharacterized protein LOC110105291 n=1 Tax=Dendrobium catenatum TaxID=906689 RepID=UPI0009F393BB|nr:uncharacterized protein LOC110105291 [Dendrobium catenatum]
MINRSTGKAPFQIVYTKAPNIVIDLSNVPKCHSPAAASFSEDYSKMLAEIRQQLIKSNSRYKAAADVHCKECLFQVGDLVMVRLRREQFPPGTYSKLAKRKLGLVPIVAKINDNGYNIGLPADCNTSSTFNVADLSPYKPADDAVVLISSSESSSSEAGED